MVLDACSHHDDDVKTFAWCVFLMPSNPIQYGRFKGLILPGVHVRYVYQVLIFSRFKIQDSRSRLYVVLLLVVQGSVFLKRMKSK